jgi:hypothetical protein
VPSLNKVMTLKNQMRIILRSNNTKKKRNVLIKFEFNHCQSIAPGVCVGEFKCLLMALLAVLCTCFAAGACEAPSGPTPWGK